MLLIINLNMAIDKTFYIPEFEKGFSYRLNPHVVLAGGKGVNVARAFRNFSRDYLLCGVISGYNGKYIKQKLKEEGIKNSMIYLNSCESRVCISVINNKGVSTDLNEEGPKLKRDDVKIIKRFILSKIVKAKRICISGRTLKGLDHSFYSEIINYSKKMNLESYLDITGKNLIAAIKAGGCNVKINSAEFEEFSKLKFSYENLKYIYIKFRNYGLKNFIITDNSKPFFAILNGTAYKIYPPHLDNFISGVGAGDSFMAGFIYFSSLKKSDVDILKYSTACAVSDCLSLGAGIINKKDIMSFCSKINVERLEEI